MKLKNRKKREKKRNDDYFQTERGQFEKLSFFFIKFCIFIKIQQKDAKSCKI